MNQPDFTRGGRGMKAPYTTTHIRLPEALKPYLEEVVQNYKLALQHNKEADFIKSLYTGVNKLNEPVNMIQQDLLIEEANKLIRSKKGAKYCLEKMLTIILKREIDL